MGIGNGLESRVSWADPADLFNSLKSLAVQIRGHLTSPVVIPGKTARKP